MDKNKYLDTLKTLKYPERKVSIFKETKNKEVQIILEEKTMDSIHNKIIEWFLKNPYPKDKDVHAFAETLGKMSEEFEDHIYMVLSSFLSEGNSKGKDVKHNPKELEMGIKVEMEHTSTPMLSRKIAMDHLVEIPDYYTRLAKMEKEAGVKSH